MRTIDRILVKNANYERTAKRLFKFKTSGVKFLNRLNYNFKTTKSNFSMFPF